MASSILNSDDGVISGTSGLKSTGGDDGVLVFQSKGTETARINTDKQIVAAAGTASLPIYSTTGDLNTGIFFPAADTIAFTEGGAEAMRIDSSGNVGIGTISPAVSVGTGLNVSGAYGVERITWTNTANSGFLEFCENSTQKAFIQYRGSTNGNGERFEIYNGANTPTLFFTNNTERMRIDSSGNVGIGTTSPNAGARLHLVNTSDSCGFFIDGQSAASKGAYLKFQKGGTDTAFIGQASPILGGGSTSNDLVFYQEGATNQLFYINGSERVRISTTNFISTVAVNVKSTTSGQQCFEAWNQATSGDNVFITFYTEGGGGTLRGSIDYNRTGGLTRYNTTSDATLKNILGDSDGAKSVEILNSTRIREYAWKDDETQKPQIGVIAQELYETYKGAVSVGGDYEVTIPAVTEQRVVSEAVLDEDGNEIEAAVYETVETEPERTETKYRPWAVDKTAFTFHLVAGWQAHEKLIKQQAETIAALEARLAALEGN
jgi:hypothetical protein